jgi:DNA-damage-inducible protein D
MNFTDRPPAIAVEPPPTGPSPFDAIRHEDENGDFWTGRQMQILMGYARWEDFSVVIEKAASALALVQGPEVAEHHFRHLPEVIGGGRWGKQTVASFRLTRLGAYLTAMAGDDTKDQVAQARVYFAARTREAELSSPPPLPEIPRTFAAALRLAADRAEEAEALKAELEQKAAVVLELEPKAAAHDRLIESGGDRLIRVVAAELGVKEHWLRTRLLSWGWIYRKSLDCGAQGYYRYAEQAENFTVKEREAPHNTRDGCWHPTLMVTPRGREAIRHKLDREQAIDLASQQYEDDFEFPRGA